MNRGTRIYTVRSFGSYPALIVITELKKEKIKDQRKLIQKGAAGLDP